MVWVKVFPSRRGEGIDRWRKIGGGRISLWAFDGGSFLLRVFGKFGSSKVTHISFFLVDRREKRSALGQGKSKPWGIPFRKPTEAKVGENRGFECL
jgi:hypothetical protein